MLPHGLSRCFIPGKWLILKHNSPLNIIFILICLNALPYWATERRNLQRNVTSLTLQTGEGNKFSTEPLAQLKLNLTACRT